MKSHKRRSGISKLTVLVLLVVLAGICLGPAQSAYCVFFSGKPAGEYPFAEDTPISIPLSAEMNPIRFNANIVHEYPRIVAGQKRTNYDGKLSLNDETIWTNRFGVTASADKEKSNSRNLIRQGSRTRSSTASIMLFDVTKEGEYEFVAKKVQSDLRVHETVLKVRRNARPIHMPLAITGFTMLIVGAIIGTILLFTKRREAKVT